MRVAEVPSMIKSRQTVAPGWMVFVRATWAVIAKDVKCEIRTRHAIGAVILFAVTSTVAVSFGLATWGSKGEIAAALLWLVIYFAAMSGLSRSFVREEETHTGDLLRLSCPPNAIYLGKLGINLLVMAMVEVVTAPLFVTLMGCRVSAWPVLASVLVLGTIALAAGATTSAAMVSKATGKGALYAVISFPLLIPVLAVAIHGSDIAMGGGKAADALGDIRMLAYYCGIVITASLMLFRFIWED